MNVLTTDEKLRILAALVEGNSIRSTERMAGTHRDTIMRLIVRVGDGWARPLNEKMRQLPSRFLQCDEIWTFVYAKQKHLSGVHDHVHMGDQYVLVAPDAETKLVPSLGQAN